MFHKKKLIVVDASKSDEDTLMSLALDAEADDFKSKGSTYEIYTAPNTLDPVVEALKAKSIEPTSAEVSMIPQNTVQVEGKNAQQVLKLMEALDEHDDVQHVYANFDMEESEMAEAIS